MKKVIVYLLCFLLFFQNSIAVYASENQDTETNAIQEQESILEQGPNLKSENSDIQESVIEESVIEEPVVEESVIEETEDEKSELEEIQSSDEKDNELEEVELQDSINEESELNDDPQYGRANGYLDDGFAGISTFSADYIHSEKYQNYTIRDVIDVSAYQKDINWEEVKRSGIDYAFIRVGFRGYGEKGSINKDGSFDTNIENAISAGIEVGVYFFSQAITEEEAIEEAGYVLDWINGYNITLPVVIDYEYASTVDGLVGRLYNANLSRESATNICSQFCAVIENNGYSPMIYANKDMLENGLNANELAENYRIWLANYGTFTTYEGEYEFWQYTDHGTVSGISGNVDKSFWYIEPEIEPEVAYAEIAENLYTITASMNFQKVLDIPNAAVEAGIDIQIFENNGTWAQKFYIRQEDEGTYIIMSANSGKVLELRENGICQSDYTGAKNQQWRFRINVDGSYSIESVQSGNVMALKNSETINGTKIQGENPNQGKNQCFMLAPESEEVAKSVADGVYFVETLLCEDKVLGVNQPERNLELSTINGDSKQKIKIEYVGKGCYQLKCLASQETLLSGEGTEVYFGQSSDNDLSSGWIFRPISKDSFHIISIKDGKNLDVTYGVAADGTVIQKYTGNGTNAQKFKLYETKAEDENVEEGIYVIHSALADSYVLDVSNASKSCSANIQLFQVNGTAAQKFAVKKNKDGTFSIYSYNSAMAISVQDNIDANMANVMQFFPVNAVGQKWNIISKGKGYYSITSCIGGKVIDVANAEVKNGSNIQIYQGNETLAQKFRFEKVGELDNFQTSSRTLENGTYTIYSSLDENKVLDVEWGSLYSGANLQLHSANGTSAQKFVIQKDSDTGFYTIVSKKSGMNISYQDGILKNTVNVYQNSSSEKGGKQWNIKHIMDDYYMIFAADSSFCFDIAYAGTANGTNVQLFDSNGTKAQIFKIVRNNDQTNTEQVLQQELEDGLYTIASSLNNGMVLDVASASTEDWANVQLYQSNQTNAQKYFVEKQDNGKYTLTVLCSDKLLSANGTNVCQLSNQNSKNQQWELIPAGENYYTVKNEGTGKVLDVANGDSNNCTNIQVFDSNYTPAQRFKFVPAATEPTAYFLASDAGNYKIRYDVCLQKNVESVDDRYYLMQVSNYDEVITSTPICSVDKNKILFTELTVSERNYLKEIAMGKLVLAVKENDGTYRAVTKPVAISNPELLAPNTAPIFKGTSKKGLQGIAYASDSNNPQPLDARYTNTKQTLINLDLANIVSKTPKSGYIEYSYRGNTYYFSDLADLKTNIKSLNFGYKQYLYGNSGRTPVAVTLCLLLGYNQENSFLIDPAARTPGHAYYTLNVREEYARETLEALFFYLGETFGQRDCYVSNWILGNEINSSKAWNYSGSLNFDIYMECYATAFKMLYTAVKSEKTGNTVSISLDNGWTVEPDTYAGKTVLDSFAKKINALNPNIDWSIAYHPYSYPLTRADFWNDYRNTTDSLSTPYISMRNITVLTNYASEIESAYGKETGSIRVLLTEQGYSYSSGAETQAMAIARGYYIAEFNDRIDAFIIRAVSDDKDEMSGKLYFGLMNTQQDKRISLYVYEHMDSDLSQFAGISAEGYVTWENYSKFNKAKEIVCNTNWSSMIPGFNAAKLAGIK